MWLVAALLAVIYMTYGLNELMEFVSFDINYTPIIETLNIPPEAIILGGGAIVSGAYITFKQVRSKYRRYFVEYLFADFLSMSNDK